MEEYQYRHLALKVGSGKHGAVVQFYLKFRQRVARHNARLAVCRIVADTAGQDEADSP